MKNILPLCISKCTRNLFLKNCPIQNNLTWKQNVKTYSSHFKSLYKILFYWLKSFVCLKILIALLSHSKEQEKKKLDINLMLFCIIYDSIFFFLQNFPSYIFLNVIKWVWIIILVPKYFGFFCTFKRYIFVHKWFKNIIYKFEELKWYAYIIIK